ncbi:MAG TPA: lipid-binding SYLF domain-containing protein [Candidatus Eisenbacteria bacterium]|nr:lipid-binding SYLF domain-containing protein [Candidatus Eisenbacteria bacterium]
MPRTTLQNKTGPSATQGLLCFFAFVIILTLLTQAFAADKAKDEETFHNANLVLQDMLNSKTISQSVLAKAECVLILPGVKKFGFGVGGSGGRGPMLCRGGEKFDGKWSAPAMFSIGGASVGFQVGGSSTDFVLLLMNPKVVHQILTGKTKMGTDATAAAGPGATAASASDADIYTYGKAKGAFAGVSLGGATVEPDNDANYRLYAKTLTATDIVRGSDVKPSGEGASLVAALDSKLAKHGD